MAQARLVIGSLALLTALGGITAVAGPAAAVATTTRYVATTGTDGENTCALAGKPCLTIQHAVDESVAGDTIVVAAGTYAESVGVSKNLTIKGAPDGGAARITGGDDDPSFLLSPAGDSATTVTLQNLDVSGNASSSGIVAFGVDLQVVNSSVDNNAADGLDAIAATVETTGSSFNGNKGTAGDGEDQIGNGTGLYLLYSLGTVDHTTAAGNAGAGVIVDADVQQEDRTPAAVADAPAALAMSRSTVSGNAFGGIVSYAGDVRAATSTVSGNAAGGVVVLDGGSADVTNSTVTTTFLPKGVEGGNEFGGVLNLQETQDARAASRVFVSRTQRTAASAALRTASTKLGARTLTRAARRVSAAVPAAVAAGEVRVTGSIVAGQTSLPDCLGPITDGGYNLSSDKADSCGFSAAKHDVVKKPAGLGPLADNGGATDTHALRKGSLALDVIPSGSAGCSTGGTDQRDFARLQPVGAKCDIGAVEQAGKPLVITTSTLPHGTVGTAYKAQLRATGGQFPTYVWTLAAGSSLPAGLTLSAAGLISGTPTKAGTYRVGFSVNDPVLKTLTLVIDAQAGTNGNGSSPLANTGSDVGTMTAVGFGGLVAGLLLLLGAGLTGHRRGRHRVLRTDR